MFIKNIFNNLKAYSYLMSQMIGRDFKIKYKRSILGIIWSLLYPLLMMIVMAIVFSRVFKFQVPGLNYLVYLLSGIVMFNYFSDATNTAMTSVVANFQLMTKVYIPKYIFPLSKCLFATINFAISLIPLFILALTTGAPITPTYLFLPYSFICLFMFSLGLGFVLSAISVILRDIFYIYGIIILIWQYFTPIFYVIDSLKPSIEITFLFKLNPLYHYLEFARTILLDGTIPTQSTFLICGLSSLIVLIIGAIIFKKQQDKFIYYI